MINPELKKFYKSWSGKAKSCEESLEGYFDKFFTLYVIYNRLYAEATFELARNEKSDVDLANKNYFPDKKAATDYTKDYLGSKNIIESLQSDSATQDALKTIEDIIKHHKFNIKLHLVEGTPQRDEDLKLLKHLRSTHTDLKAKAVLELIYAIRCNMFHAHKGFYPAQEELLKPMIKLLEKLNTILFAKLTNS